MFVRSAALHVRRSCWLIASMLPVLLASSCPMNPDGGGPEQPIFPADYRQTFRLVRDCRNSIEHANTIRVWINASSADAYLADANPLPVGTIVVKEEFASASCTDDA